MRLKDLFTVPTGQRVTEKHLRRVLISSICSILLCMTCLVSTTWAWFTVRIENAGNVIQIATVSANVSITDHENNAVDKSSENQYELQAGTYAIEVKAENDSTEWKRPVYVLMSAMGSEKTDYYYFTFLPNSAEAQKIELSCIDPVTVSFSVSWVEPASAISVENETVISDEIPTEPETDPSTEATEPSADMTVPTEEATTPSTEESANPTTESTEPTAAATEATTPTTGEPPDPDAGAATAPATAPTSIPTDATEAVTEPGGTTSPTETD